jgi:uncharacterized protein (DUF1330 family)
MPAYLIADIDVTDPDRYAEYVRRVPATIAAYGGKYLVRGGEVQVLEGERQPHRTVMLEFESVARAREWWSSDGYEELKPLRREASRASILLVEGHGNT